MNIHEIIKLTILLYFFIIIVFMVYYMGIQIIPVKDQPLVSGGIVPTEDEMTDEDAIAILNKGLKHNLICNKILEVAEKVEFKRAYESVRYKFYYKNYVFTCGKLYCDKHLIFESRELIHSLMEIYNKKQKDLLFEKQQEALRCLEKE